VLYGVALWMVYSVVLTDLDNIREMLENPFGHTDDVVIVARMAVGVLPFPSMWV
jgi:hypothetical protein